MKTEQEIRERLNWLIEAVDEDENQNDKAQCKLWAQIDFIRWLGVQNG